MILKNLKFSRLSTTLIFLFAVIIAQFSHVQFTYAVTTDTWTGTAGDNKFSTVSNWSGGAAPVAGDSLVFNVASLSSATTLNNDITNLSVAGITFSGHSTPYYTYTISGNPITLNGPVLNTSTGGSSNSVLSNLIDTNVILGSNVTIDSTGIGSAGNTLDTQGHSISMVGTTNCSVYLSSQLLGSGDLVINTGASTSGVVLSSNSSSFSGAIRVTGGVLKFDAARPGVLGNTTSATVVSGSGSLSILNNTTQSLSEPFSFSGSGNISTFKGSQLGLSGCAGGNNDNSPYTLTLNGGITLQSDFQYYSSDNVNLLVSGTYDANGHTFSVASGSVGTLNLPGGTTQTAPVVTNTYSDSQPTVNVSAGKNQTIVLDGTRQYVNVDNGGILMGNGTALSINIGSSGIIAPGHSPGKMTATQSLSISGTYQAQLKDATIGDYDQIQVSDPSRTTGNDVQINTGATLDISLYDGWSIKQGDKFTIIDNLSATAVSGTFTGMAEGSQFVVKDGAVSITFSISYVGGDGNDVVLTALNTGSDPTPPNTGAMHIITANPIILSGLGIITAGILIFAATRRRNTN